MNAIPVIGSTWRLPPTVPDGDVIAARAGGREMALMRQGEKRFAIACTHGAAKLCGGFVEPDGSIECPLHHGRFDVGAGKAPCAPLAQDLAVHAVRVVAGRLLVKPGS